MSAATFDPALPSAKDRLRLLLGDTGKAPTNYVSGPYDIAPPVADFPDVTYTTTLAQSTGSETAAALTLAQALLVKFGRMPSKVTIGPDTFDYEARIKSLQALITQLTATQSAQQGLPRRRMHSHPVTRG